MEEKKDRLPINLWAESDRPREKLIERGKSSLTDAELLAILIGSGNREETAVELCRRILNNCDNNLIELSKMSLAQFTKYKGMGEAKAISIIAAMELGRRRRESEMPIRQKVRSTKDAYEAIAPLLTDLKHEEFCVLYLSRSNEILKKEIVSSGGVAGTVVDAKIIFKKAIELLASAIILAHNHPSGNLTPSESDKKITRKIVEAGKMLEIDVFDHLIISESGYYSFADSGLI